jgi:hypothetical protein
VPQRIQRIQGSSISSPCLSFNNPDSSIRITNAPCQSFTCKPSLVLNTYSSTEDHVTIFVLFESATENVISHLPDVSFSFCLGVLTEKQYTSRSKKRVISSNPGIGWICDRLRICREPILQIRWILPSKEPVSRFPLVEQRFQVYHYPVLVVGYVHPYLEL